MKECNNQRVYQQLQCVTQERRNAETQRRSAATRKRLNSCMVCSSFLSATTQYNNITNNTKQTCTNQQHTNANKPSIAIFLVIINPAYNIQTQDIDPLTVTVTIPHNQQYSSYINIYKHSSSYYNNSISINTISNTSTYIYIGIYLRNMSAERMCHRCGRKGHMVKNCPTPSGDPLWNVSSSLYSSSSCNLFIYSSSYTTALIIEDLREMWTKRALCEGLSQASLLL